MNVSNSETFPTGPGGSKKKREENRLKFWVQRGISSDVNAPNHTQEKEEEKDSIMSQACNSSVLFCFLTFAEGHDTVYYGAILRSVLPPTK